METLRALTLICLAIAVALWSGWFGWYGKPAIEEATNCCERNKAMIAVLDTEIAMYQEQVKRLIANNERLVQEIADVKSKQPVKWRVK